MIKSWLRKTISGIAAQSLSVILLASTEKTALSASSAALHHLFAELGKDWTSPYDVAVLAMASSVDGIEGVWPICLQDVRPPLHAVISTRTKLRTCITNQVGERCTLYVGQYL